MNFNKNILGTAVLLGTVLLAGQAVASGSIDSPFNIPDTAVDIDDINNYEVGGVNYYGEANTAVGNLIEAKKNTKDLSDQLAGLNKQIREAELRIEQADNLRPGELIGGLTKADIKDAYDLDDLNGKLKDKADEVDVAVAAEATAQAAVDTLATGSISNTLILAFQAAKANEKAVEENGTINANSGSKTLGKDVYDAQQKVAQWKSTVDLATAALNSVQSEIDDGKGALEDAGALSYQASDVDGSDATDRYTLTTTAVGTVIDIRDQTKQILWTLGAANSSAENTGTLEELVDAIGANDMTFTAETSGSSITLTATDTKLGKDYTPATVSSSVDGVLSPTNVSAVLSKSQKLTTYTESLAERRAALFDASRELSVASGNATNKEKAFETAEDLKDGYAASEKSYLTDAGKKMANLADVLNEELARADAKTAKLEAEAVVAENATAKDEAALATAQTKLTSATESLAAADKTKKEAEAAYTKDKSQTNKDALNAAEIAFNVAASNESQAKLEVNTASDRLYGDGLKATTPISLQTGTKNLSHSARAEVVRSEAKSNTKRQFMTVQVQLAEAGNPAGPLQAGLIAKEDSAALIVTAVNSNFQATKTNAAGIATNSDNISANTGKISANTVGIRTNADNIQTNANDILTNAKRITTNQTDIATNKTGIAANKTDIATNKTGIEANAGKIADLSSSFADNTANLQRVEMQLNADVDMLKSGIASTLAIAGMPTVSGEGMGFSVGTGYYDGESAIAMGLTYVEGNRSYKLSFGNSGGETSASAGAAFKF